MNTDKYISLDNLNYFAGGFKSLIKDTTVPSIKLKPSGSRDYIQRTDIKNLGEGSFVCYIDESNRYRVNSKEYIYGPAIFFTSYSVIDLGEGNKDVFDFLVLSPTVAKRYKTNQDDPASFKYSWIDYVTSDNVVNSISEISSDSSIPTLNISSPIGVVTNPVGITISWIDYTNSTAETMLLPYNTFILGNTSEAIVNSGDVQILMPNGKRYNVSNLTATAATVTEIATGSGSSFDYEFYYSNSASTNKGAKSANAIDLNTLKKGHKYRFINSPVNTTYFYYKYNLGNGNVSNSLRVDTQVSNYTSLGQGRYMQWNRVDIEMLADISDFNNLARYQPIAILTFNYDDGTYAPNNVNYNARVEAVIYKSSAVAIDATCTWGYLNNYGLAHQLSSIISQSDNAIQQCNALDTRVTALEQSGGSGEGIPVINFSDISTESTGHTYLDITSIEALNLSIGNSVFVKQNSAIELNTGNTNNVTVYPSLWCLTKSENSMKSTVYSLRQVTEGYGSSPKRILSFEISGTGGVTDVMGFAYSATTI